MSKSRCTCGWAEEQHRIDNERMVRHQIDNCPYLGLGGSGCPAHGTNDCDYCPLHDGQYNRLAARLKQEDDQEKADFHARCEAERLKHPGWTTKK